MDRHSFSVLCVQQQWLDGCRRHGGGGDYQWRECVWRGGRVGSIVGIEGCAGSELGGVGGW